MRPASPADFGQVEHRCPQAWIAAASLDRQMARAASHVDKMMKAAQVEGRNRRRRAEQSGTVHAGEKGNFVLLGGKEVVEQFSLRAELLLPAVAALAHSVLEPAPQPVEDPVGVENVARQGLGAFDAQEAGCGRLVAVLPAFDSQEAEPYARAQQPLEFQCLDAESVGEIRTSRGTLV